MLLNKRLFLHVFFGIAFFSGLAGCSPPTVDRILKVTVAIKADGVVYRGSGIRRIICHGAVPFFGSMSTGGCATLGEATVVEVGNYGPIFLTVSYEGAESAISQGRAGSLDPRKWTIPIAEQTRMPQLIWFSNALDVKTMKAVDPNDLAATMGRGVAFDSITVEQLDSGEVTYGEVIKHLPWLEEVPAEDRPFDMKYKELIGKSIGSISPSRFLGNGK